MTNPIWSPEKVPLMETSFGMSHQFADESGKKFLYLKGPFLEANRRNRNGRIYPTQEIHRVVQEMAQKIAEGGPIAGELDHPEGLNMNFDRLSHAITEIRMDGNFGVGVIKVADNPHGHQIRSAVELGIRVGVSSRGSGSVDHDGNVSDYSMVTIDAVLQPSANAYPTPVIEAFESNLHGREFTRLAGFIRDDERAQLYMKREAERFFTAIRDQVKWGNR
jgi:hypothetical protein